MFKVITIIGARPQFIKAAVVSRALKAYAQIEEIIIHTGQHFDANMSDVFFDELSIPEPKYTLDIHGLNHGAMTGRMMEKIEAILVDEKPNIVIVFGDTNSTLAGALTAKKLNIPIAHIEAGVRNHDETMPEEVNRYLVDRMSALNFCCTQLGVDNLHAEGFNNGKIQAQIHFTGDVMYDAFLAFKSAAANTSTIIQTLGLENKPFILTTIHRAANTDNPQHLAAITSVLNELHRITPVVFPIHPRTRNKIKELGLETHFISLDPIGYLDMVQLLTHAQDVITDSGGVIRETYFLNKKSISLLEQPVWPEIVEQKASINVSYPSIDNLKVALHDLTILEPTFIPYTYGDGHAGEKIAEIIMQYLDTLQK